MKKMTLAALSVLVASIGITGALADDHNSRHGDEYNSRGGDEHNFRHDDVRYCDTQYRQDRDPHMTQREAQWERDVVFYRYLAKHPQARKIYFSEQNYRRQSPMWR
jgi:GrpB-like predicted nucleotidyltransferase (UPF0157 family)